MTIEGPRIYTEKELVKACGLEAFPVNESAFREASRRINNFYYRRGYYIAVTYRIEETPDTLSLFVDEGRLGQIIIKGVHDITLLRLKYSFSLEKRTYNRPALDRQLARHARNYGFKEIRATLVEAKDYSRQFIQLDGSFQVPFLGEQRLPVFEQFGYRYNLILEPVFYSRNEAEKKMRGLEYGIRLGYPAISPKAKYTLPSLFSDGDVFQLSGSFGVPISIRNPLRIPKISFISTETGYDFTPVSFFVPRARASAYYSSDARPDIGVLSYKYVRTNAVAEPGVTILSHLKLYPGAGLERVFFFREKTEQIYEKEYRDLKGEHIFKTASLNTEMSGYIGLLFPNLVKSATAGYTWFIDGEMFHRIDASLHSDFAVRKNDIFTVATHFFHLWGDVPFYYEHAVTDDMFLGFSGRDYYTRLTLKLKLEYITSIYRDFVFFGPYLHNVAFRGCAPRLNGKQYGTAAGITGRWVFWDQFEARIYAGKDLLWSKKEFGTDIAFSIRKKF